MFYDKPAFRVCRAVSVFVQLLQKFPAIINNINSSIYTFFQGYMYF